MAVEAGGIGARLRAGREKLGLTVLQVAERIHTDPKIVEAIEAENYEALGAPVYARGHIRHYAELVGESATELIALYSGSSKVAQPDLTRIVKVPAGIDSNKLVAPALLVIAVFAVAGAVWWVSALSKKKPQLSETHVVGDEAPAVAPESAPDATAMQAQPAPSGAAGSNAVQSRSGGTAASGGMATPGGAGGSAMQGRPGTAVPQGTAPAPGRTGTGANSGRAQTQGGTTQAGAATAGATQARARGAPATAATQAASTATPPRSKNQAQVTLHYSADSWTEVYDASGARLFYDVGAANSVKTVVGTPPLRVVLGNASGVAVEFNGRNTPVAKLALPDGSVQFSINRSGRVVRAKPVADGG
ncbi:MAG TPA: RodZ domain-containing protein [Steroidobacteraceae bacterium]|nr:RodZ domain-containing protein [Steroidobacteraceae bacterium]